MADQARSDRSGRIIDVRADCRRGEPACLRWHAVYLDGMRIAHPVSASVGLGGNGEVHMLVMSTHGHPARRSTGILLKCAVGNVHIVPMPVFVEAV